MSKIWPKIFQLRPFRFISNSIAGNAFRRVARARRHGPNGSGKFYNFGLLVPSFGMNTSLWHKSGEKEDMENNIVHLATLAKVALERGEVERAETILNLAVQTTEEHNLFSSIVYLYDMLVTIALLNGDVPKAERLLATVIEKLTSIGFREDNHSIVEFQLQLARIYSAKDDGGLASIGFQSCLDHQRVKIAAGDSSEKTGLLYVNISFWYAVHKHRSREYGHAQALVSDAFEYSKQIIGVSPKQEMILLYLLSEVNCELENYDKAVHCLKDAIVLGNGFGSVDLPSCYLKLGKVYQKLEHYEEAVPVYKAAIKLARTYGFLDICTEAEDGLDEIKVLTYK